MEKEPIVLDDIAQGTFTAPDNEFASTVMQQMVPNVGTAPTAQDVQAVVGEREEDKGDLLDNIQNLIVNTSKGVLKEAAKIGIGITDGFFQAIPGMDFVDADYMANHLQSLLGDEVAASYRNHRDGYKMAGEITAIMGAGAAGMGAANWLRQAAMSKTALSSPWLFGLTKAIRGAKTMDAALKPTLAASRILSRTGVTKFYNQPIMKEALWKTVKARAGGVLLEEALTGTLMYGAMSRSQMTKGWSVSDYYNPGLLGASVMGGVEALQLTSALRKVMARTAAASKSSITKFNNGIDGQAIVEMPELRGAKLFREGAEIEYLKAERESVAAKLANPANASQSPTELSTRASTINSYMSQRVMAQDKTMQKIAMDTPEYLGNATSAVRVQDADELDALRRYFAEDPAAAITVRSIEEFQKEGQFSFAQKVQARKDSVDGTIRELENKIYDDKATPVEKAKYKKLMETKGKLANQKAVVISEFGAEDIDSYRSISVDAKTVQKRTIAKRSQREMAEAFNKDPKTAIRVFNDLPEFVTKSHAFTDKAFEDEMIIWQDLRNRGAIVPKNLSSADFGGVNVPKNVSTRSIVEAQPYQFLDALVSNYDTDDAVRRFMDSAGLSKSRLAALSFERKMNRMVEYLKAVDAEKVSPMDGLSLNKFFNISNMSIDSLANKLSAGMRFLNANGIKTMVKDLESTGVDFESLIGPMAQKGMKDFSKVVVSEAVPSNTHMMEAARAKAIAAEESKLSNLSKSSVLSVVTDTYQNNPNLVAEVRKVGMLADEAVRGNTFFSQSFAAGASAPLRAAQEFNGRVTQQIQLKVNAVLEPANAATAKLMDPANKGDLINYAMVRHSLREGWEVLPDPATLPDGTRALVLNPHSKFNKKHWRERFGEEMPEELLEDSIDELAPVYLPSPNEKVPLSISENAFQLLAAIKRVGHEAYVAANAVRRANGVSELAHREWWVPPAMVKRSENLTFLADDTGAIRYSFTSKEAAEKALRNNTGMHIVTYEALNEYKAIHGDTLFEIGKSIDDMTKEGTRAGKANANIVDYSTASLKDDLHELNSSLQASARRSILSLFEDSWEEADMMMSVAGATSKENNVWTRYARGLTGSSTLMPGSVLGRLNTTAELAFSNAVQAFVNLGETLATGYDKANRAAMIKRDYDAYCKTIGAEYKPFSTATEFLEKTITDKSVLSKYLPRHLREAAAQLNMLTTLVTYRISLLSTPLINFASLIATTPQVVSMAKRIDGESLAEYSVRTGTFFDNINENTKVFSPFKLMTRVFKEMFTEEGKKIYRKARQSGVISLTSEEQIASLTNIDLLDKPNMTKALSLANKASILTERSEEFSRALSYHMGYTLAKNGLGLTDESAIDGFARWFTNSNVGNYLPQNKPRIFQGALGMPLGLFTTFIQNYNERLLWFVEEKGLRHAAASLATQAALFGTKSLPGSEMLTNIMTPDSDPGARFEDKLRLSMNPDIYQWISQGTLTNLPKMFGADEGIALYTKGDVNPRIPLVDGIQSLPSFTAFKAMKDWIGGMLTGHPIDATAQYAPNRLLRSATELVLGKSLDRQGTVINDDLQTIEGVTSRLFGVRTQSEQELMEASWTTSNIQREQNAMMDKVRAKIRSAARHNSLSSTKLAEIAQEAINAGYNPQALGKLIAENIERGLHSKYKFQFEKMLKSSNPDEQRNVIRFLHSMLATWDTVKE